MYGESGTHQKTKHWVWHKRNNLCAIISVLLVSARVQSSKLALFVPTLVLQTLVLTCLGSFTVAPMNLITVFPEYGQSESMVSVTRLSGHTNQDTCLGIFCPGINFALLNRLLKWELIIRTWKKLAGGHCTFCTPHVVVDTSNVWTESGFAQDSQFFKGCDSGKTETWTTLRKKYKNVPGVTVLIDCVLQARR